MLSIPPFVSGLKALRSCIFWFLYIYIFLCVMTCDSLCCGQQMAPGLYQRQVVSCERRSVKERCENCTCTESRAVLETKVRIKSSVNSHNIELSQCRRSVKRIFVTNICSHSREVCCIGYCKFRKLTALHWYL